MIFVENLDTIWLAIHITESDSCKTILFLKIHQAIATGKQTNHHLQKITSGLNLEM